METYKIRSAISDVSHLGLHGYSAVTGDLMGRPWELKCYTNMPVHRYEHQVNWYYNNNYYYTSIPIKKHKQMSRRERWEVCHSYHRMAGKNWGITTTFFSQKGSMPKYLHVHEGKLKNARVLQTTIPKYLKSCHVIFLKKINPVTLLNNKINNITSEIPQVRSAESRVYADHRTPTSWR